MVKMNKMTIDELKEMLDNKVYFLMNFTIKNNTYTITQKMVSYNEYDVTIEKRITHNNTRPVGYRTNTWYERYKKTLKCISAEELYTKLDQWKLLDLELMNRINIYNNNNMFRAPLVLNQIESWKEHKEDGLFVIERIKKEIEKEKNGRNREGLIKYKNKQIREIKEFNRRIENELIPPLKEKYKIELQKDKYRHQIVL